MQETYSVFSILYGFFSQKKLGFFIKTNTIANFLVNLQHKHVNESCMVTTQLNNAQLNILSLMSYIDTEQEQQELQDILLQFYRKKADSLLLEFQQENGITQQTLDDWANQHERTPYGQDRPIL